MSSRILPEFDLLLPQSIAETIDYLSKHGDSAAVMAGGTDLMVGMKSGTAPEYVISLAEIPDLDYIEFDQSTGLKIGAMTTMNQIINSSVIKENYPALWKSASKNGTEQTRNVATVVGNILRASPAGDCSCAVLAHGGSVVLQGSEGSREVAIDDFWIDYQVTARKNDELALELKLPASNNSTVSSFSALTRTTEDLSKVNAAVSLSMDGNVCKAARLAMGAVGPTHLRLKKSEAILQGVELTDEILNKVVDSVPNEINPIDDVRSSAEYRKTVSGVLIRRVIQEALNRT